MNTISRYTDNQKKGLLEMLEGQKSPMTRSEKTMLTELREYFSDGEIVTALNGFELIRKGDKVKLLGFDDCGDGWRNTWVKVYETSKGEYFKMEYLDNKRIYLN